MVGTRPRRLADAAPAEGLVNVTHSKQRLLLVFGLDGATESVIGLPDAGLPALERMRRPARPAGTASVTPPVTAAAWPSMLTGLSPGSHGIFDFQRTPFDWYPESSNPGAAEYQGTRRFHDSRAQLARARLLGRSRRLIEMRDPRRSDDVPHLGRERRHAGRLPAS